MTVVCAITTGSVAYLGSDTVSCTNQRTMDVGSKWVMADGWAFANSGDWRTTNIVEHRKAEIFGDLDSPFEFVERLRRALLDANYRPTWQGDWHSAPGFQMSGILATPEKLWSLDATLSLVPVPVNVLHARGSGGDEASAAAWGYNKARPGSSPEILIEVAILAAAAHNYDIRGMWQGRLARPKPSD